MAGGGAGGVFGAFAQDAGLVDPHGCVTVVVWSPKLTDWPGRAQDYYRNQLHQQIAQAQVRCRAPTPKAPGSHGAAQAQQSNPGYYDALRYGVRVLLTHRTKSGKGIFIFTVCCGARTSRTPIPAKRSRTSLTLGACYCMACQVLLQCPPLCPYSACLLSCRSGRSRNQEILGT
jgi:hypothetical protein